jgi:ABC-type antimicrobial peptide transport system permease subunit
MKRHRALLEHVLGALFRRRGRNAAITLGMAALVGLFSSVLFVSEALRAEYRALAVTLPDLTVQQLVAGRPALVEAAAITRIEALALPGLASIRPRVWGYLYVPSIEGNVVIVGGAGTDAPGVLEGGRWAEGEDEIVIGNGIAHLLGARVGDELALAGPGAAPAILRVVGVLSGQTAALSADLVLTTDARARALLGMTAAGFTDLAVTLARPEEAGVVAEAIATALPGARLLDRRLLERTHELTFDARAGFLGAVMLPALLALLLLAWDRLTGLGDAERREIGVLKAVGWSTSDVLAARMWESALVGLVGATLGLVMGYVHAFVFGAPGLADALFGWSSLHASLSLPPALDFAQLLAILGAVVVPFVGVSVVPAWRAAMLDPDRLLRGGP